MKTNLAITTAILSSSLILGGALSAKANEAPSAYALPAPAPPVYPAYPSVHPLVGTWKVQWFMSGYHLDGTLQMSGDRGNMTVEISYPDGRVYGVIRQQMQLQRSPRGWILSGYNPINVWTNLPDPVYIPDTFFLQPSAYGLSGRSCDRGGVCAAVNVQQVGYYY